MSIQYDRPTIQALMENLSEFHRSFFRSRDALAADFGACRAKYTRLRNQIEEMLNRARRALEDAEQDARSAQAEYNAAMQDASSAEKESDQQAARARAQQAQQKLAQAQQDAARAAAELRRQQAKMAKLSSAWEAHGPAAESGLNALDGEQNTTAVLVQSANRDLGQFMQMMEQARSDLYGGNSGVAAGTAAAAGIAAAAVSGSGGSSPGAKTAAVSAAPAAGSTSGAAASAGVSPSGTAGWCSGSSMRAVTADAGGKSISLSIGGSTRRFSCDKNGLAEAYGAAVSAGDADMTARISAMFEIETLREDLELEAGDPAFAQLGGYHRDVRPQDPAGYESHHIPARSVQDANADWLPTISITAEDHSFTASYRGRQNHVSHLVTDPTDPGLRYKDNVSQRIARGGTGYIEALRNEIWDLRVCTGHRYDGGISGYLDAVLDMLATRGIPGSK